MFLVILPKNDLDIIWTSIDSIALGKINIFMGKILVFSSSW